MATPTPTPDPAPDAPSQSGPEPDPAPEQAPLEPPVASAPPLPTDPPQLDVIQAGPDDRSKDEAPVAHITRSPSPPKDPVPVASGWTRTTTYRPHLPLTAVQTAGEAGQILTARQLGQRARRARERELQAQGLYTPKRRTSSTTTMPDPPMQAQPPSADVTMQSADEGGDDDGEGELESEVNGTTTPSVPPHSASHLIPPIAVLAPVTTPSRASLAQRARRDRERVTRLGISPNASLDGTSEPQPPASVQPIPFNPAAAQPPPPTLTRGQLAQRARRARERVERASKSANGNPLGENWTPSLNSSDLALAHSLFDQVFKSLTAGDNGVSRAVADSGAGVLTAGGRTSSPAERITSPSAPVFKTEATQVEEPMDVDAAEENVDQLSEELAPAPTPTPAPAPAPAPATLRPPTPPIQTVSSPKPQPEVHRSAIQSVGA
ncbi:hypothetical protein RSAG8_03192, partial [Rhizoctonia solani AG-8 WAC10335]